MGFFIRKSVRIGPLRFNLSKSGIGVSTGIPGFRVGTGPRGTYVHMGRGGLYYRQTLSAPTPRNQALDRPLSNTPFLPLNTHGPMNAISSGCVTEMVDTNSAALLSEIEQRQARISWWPIVLVSTLIASALLLVGDVTLWITVPCAMLFLVGTVAVYQYDRLRKNVVLMYDLEGPSLDSYQTLHAAVDEMSRCGAVWNITAQGDVHDPKYHAGAGQLINRRRLSVAYGDPPYVKTNLSVPFLPLGQHSLYLLPDRVLVYAPKGVGSVEYDALNLSVHITRFIEEGNVPHDAQVVDHTWQYVNKNGEPDRRFRSNRQIPICHYEELRLASTTGIQEILQLSRLGVADKLQSAITEVVQSVQIAEAAEAERTSREAQFRQQSIEETQATVQAATVPEATPPTPQMLHAAIFDVLCCIMVADGRASTNEKAAIREVMTRIRSGWTDDDCDARIGAFIDEIKLRGYSFVVQRTMSQLPMFKGIGRESILLKCIDMVASVDGTASERERELCNRIRRTVSPSTPNGTE